MAELRGAIQDGLTKAGPGTIPCLLSLNLNALNLLFIFAYHSLNIGYIVAPIAYRDIPKMIAIEFWIVMFTTERS
jgi:hypothetical protein